MRLSGVLLFCSEDCALALEYPFFKLLDPELIVYWKCEKSSCYRNRGREGFCVLFHVLRAWIEVVTSVSSKKDRCESSGVKWIE